MARMPHAVRYREYLPSPALRNSARSFFTFREPNNEHAARRALWEIQFGSSERLCAPTFADGHACIVFNFEREYCPDGIWRRCPEKSSAILLGPMTAPGPPVVPTRRESRGVYHRPGRTIAGVPLAHLENRAIPLSDVWGEHAQQLWERLRDTPNDGFRIHLLEQSLLQKIELSHPHPWIPKIAAWINANHGRLTVDQLTEAVGLSRQHFTRVFHEHIGVSPKIYSELARFQAALCYLRNGNESCAEIAVAAGYADQSHMISEFRRFSSLTPSALQHDRWFHPFMEQSAWRLPTRL